MSKSTKGKPPVVSMTSLREAVPGFDAECCHPACHATPQSRFEFPIPLCSRHIVNVMARAIEVAREATRDHVVQNKASVPRSQGTSMTHDPIVYYVKFGDRVKIGTTTNFQQRMSEVPHDVVLAIEPGGREVEARRHSQFATSRITREWFDLSEELIHHIRLIEGNQLPA